jgi:hypothetical protein
MSTAITERTWTGDGTDHFEHGLHRHAIEGNLVRCGVAELVGTFILVLTIIGTAIAATLAKPVAGEAYGSVAVPSPAAQRSRWS